jgi:hypothetical protein
MRGNHILYAKGPQKKSGGPHFGHVKDMIRIETSNLFFFMKRPRQGNETNKYLKTFN